MTTENAEKVRSLFKDKEAELAEMVYHLRHSHFFYKWNDQSFKAFDMAHNLIERFSHLCKIEGYHFMHTPDFKHKYREGDTTVKTDETHIGNIFEKAKKERFTNESNDNWLVAATNCLAAASFIAYITTLLERWVIKGEELTGVEEWAILSMYSVR
jgi:hypothetical protein